MKPDTFILNGWYSLHLVLLIAWNVLQNGKIIFLPSATVVLFSSLLCFSCLSSARAPSSQLGDPAGSFLPSMHCPSALGIISSRSKQPVPVFSVFCIAHCKGSSVLAHRCMQLAVTSMLWKWELQQLPSYVCVMWAVRPGTLWEGVRER